MVASFWSSCSPDELAQLISAWNPSYREAVIRSWYGTVSAVPDIETFEAMVESHSRPEPLFGGSLTLSSSSQASSNLGFDNQVVLQDNRLPFLSGKQSAVNGDHRNHVGQHLPVPGQGMLHPSARSAPPSPLLPGSGQGLLHPSALSAPLSPMTIITKSPSQDQSEACGLDGNGGNPTPGQDSHHDSVQEHEAQIAQASRLGRRPCHPSASARASQRVAGHDADSSVIRCGGCTKVYKARSQRYFEKHLVDHHFDSRHNLMRRSGLTPRTNNFIHRSSRSSAVSDSSMED